MSGVRWERRLHQAGASSALALAPGHLVVHERNTRLVSLDPADGSVRWDVPVGTWPRAVVITGRRCLLLPQNTGLVLCLDLDSGDRVWTAGPYGFVGHLVVADDVVFVGGWRGYTPLRALDLGTGRLRWEADLREHIVRPMQVGAGLLTGRPGDRVLRLLDRRDGRPLTTWSLPSPLGDHETAFVADEAGGVLVRCGSRSIARLVPSAGTAELVVEADLPAVTMEYLGGLLWLWDRRSGYTLVNPSDGRTRGRVDPGRQLVGSVVPAGGGYVVAETNGALLRLSPQGRIGDRVVVGRRIRALHGLEPSGLLVVTKGSLLAFEHPG
ncbi:PQQ-binding-like beta-propeller repeat protein [Amycolatopsis suaedae]|uniref:Pyrrolo-quinoline quinone repeat domain-containing protein n=1 Tax=Amycolatopsis suaedae TaxID=2510978 RepID=A0A4Q7J1W7_9PSEU|nr:PQQ-binding-like beta-propeller repeat protein [Amycolatopsis suaedae]RZQ59934.1 hypothetical protein EWH70_31375 [Amycolatopsis suaedae]